MENKRYKLCILPIFERDLNEIVDYIAFKLKNPDAAKSLVDNVEKAIYKRLEHPEAFEKFNSLKKESIVITEFLLRTILYFMLYLVILWR